MSASSKNYYPGKPFPLPTNQVSPEFVAIIAKHLGTHKARINILSINDAGIQDVAIEHALKASGGHNRIGSGNECLV